MLQWKLFRSKTFAISWLVFITFLFFLPGSALPKQNWLTEIRIDKWVHVIFFAVLIFLWRSAFNWRDRNIAVYLLLSALLYGAFIEFAQGQWVAYRSFDIYDLLSDMAGSILGLLIWQWGYKKNKPL